MNTDTARAFASLAYALDNRKNDYPPGSQARLALTAIVSELHNMAEEACPALYGPHD